MVLSSELRRYIENKIYAECPMCQVVIYDELPLYPNNYEVKIHYYAFGVQKGVANHFPYEQSVQSLDCHINSLLHFLRQCIEEDKSKREEKRYYGSTTRCLNTSKH